MTLRAPARPPAAETMIVPLADLQASPLNPRKSFPEATIAELAASIASVGLLQALVVRARPAGGFEIVCGECRFRAATRAGLTQVPVTVRDLTDGQVLELALMENIHRKNLTPLEEARGYRALIDAAPDKHSADSIATRIGMSPAWVWDRLKLNDLVPEAAKLLASERMAIGHAILIARLAPADQARVITPGDGGFGGRDRGGLWAEEAARLDLDDRPTKADKYAGLKPVSIRELDAWINRHVRFDVTHAAKAQPLTFEPLAARVEAAEAQPGRGRKVIAITFEHFTQPEARSDEERTFGPSSWKRADGTTGAPSCDAAILGVVAAGAHRGEAFDVCIARDRCLVHWKAVVRAKAKSQKLRDAGQTKAADRSDARRAAAEARAEAARLAKSARWEKFLPALRAAVRAAAAKAPAPLPRALYVKVLAARGLPTSTTPAKLPKALLERSIARVFQYANHYDERALVAWAKLLGVDVKACELKSAAAKTTKTE